MLDDLRQTGEQAARAAGAEALRLMAGAAPAREKGFRDLVTEGDLAAQRAAVSVIAARFPGHQIIGEEDDSQAKPHAAGDLTWFIDPIDGTTNYTHSLPFFSVSVAVTSAEGLAAGAIFDPLRDHLFAAARGQGATLNGTALHVSGKPLLAASVVGFDSPRDPDLRRAQWDLVYRISSRCHSLRAFGSAALGLAFVAAGWLDAYVHFDLNTWDAAAGALLVAEAGGKAVGPGGNVWQPGERFILASTPAVLQPLLDLVAESPQP